MPIVIGIGGFVAVLFIASQVYLVTTLTQTQSDLVALESQVESVDGAVADLSVDIAAAATQPPSQPSPVASPAPAILEGFLPRYTRGAQDTALGLKLPTIEGTDAYAETATSVDPTDGTKRVWLIWAHWCPYCQEELPGLSDWYPTAADKYPNSEFVTVTTSVDPTRGNPLPEYLASEQFPFAVVVDSDTKIAAQFGVSAFPFWVVTNGDGTVLYRTAGLIGLEAVDQLFTQLEQIDAAADAIS
jgi:thiol-disulfide isomerase/thioredoxin